MESHIDRAENAARVQVKSDRVRNTSESAKEKDDKFSKVLREKMKEEQREKRKQKQKKKKKDEVLLANKPEETTEPVEPSVETDESDDNSATPESQDKRELKSVDLRA